MKRLLFLTIIVALVASLSLWGANVAPGYVLFDWLGYTAEMTVWVLIFTLIVIYVVIKALGRLFMTLVLSPFKAKNWLFNRDDQQLQSVTAHALAAFEEGHWLRARKLLLKVAKHSKNPLVFYLMAARASHALNDNEQVTVNLKAATNAAPAASMAINLTQAQLQLKDGNLESCLATLVRAHAMDEDHPEVMRMLASVYCGLGEWEKLNQLLPKIKRQQVLSENEINQYVIASAKACLANAAEQSVDAVQECLKQLLSSAKSQPSVVLVYLKALQQFGPLTKSDIDVLKSAVRANSTSESLLLFFSETYKPVEQGLQFLQKLKVEQNTAAYFLAMARLAKAADLQGQTEAYLKQAKSILDDSDSDIAQTVNVELAVNALEAKQTDKALALIKALQTS